VGAVRLSALYGQGLAIGGTLMVGAILVRTPDLGSKLPAVLVVTLLVVVLRVPQLLLGK
jgi:hypothetical protein